jgi:type IV secretory pathway protease TraF
MNPTISDGDMIKLINKPAKVGDIVGFQLPGEKLPFIKRVIKIENGNLWVEGDNKEHSADSRVFGWITPDKVIGVVTEVKYH